MKYYEILYIINPNYEQDRLSKAMDGVAEELKKGEVEIINHRLWGKKRLAYMIQNHKYGTFIILEFGTEQTGFMLDFNLFMKLNKAVIRTQTIKLDEKPEEYKEDEVTEISKKESPRAATDKKESEPTAKPTTEVASDSIAEKPSDEVAEKPEAVDQAQEQEPTAEKVDENTSDEDEEKVEKED
jgi:small subunit ribosomal protein S6